jgi:hypothetical protein
MKSDLREVCTSIRATDMRGAQHKKPRDAQTHRWTGKDKQAGGRKGGQTDTCLSMEGPRGGHKPVVTAAEIIAGYAR